ncbi:50S ribosomal protein L10 [Candidatus Nomurabacteria bacterium RIFCSPHIGHO2_01_FULL_39_9]|uniref:Large ribosomal subunit protein uL10 n=1 Tax=Candidatus Nomurabacteria bacterium RIFCSPHIGHO2_01_FULL_39_9 TaxID=1801735 RepID=A0A1F6UW68_9BACT|nr:MAG: 50S ribosomal protein L10 [Candidatus Nomurabacteria bacterium RIFCSPHIGHO2_01_FULL_39_9]
MPLTRQKKGEILDGLKKTLKDANSVVFVNFHGLKMPDTFALRRKLREFGVGLKVAKKTLIKKAFEGSGVEGELPELPGEIAVGYGTDALAPAREVYNFGKGKLLAIVGGVFEGKFLGAEKMNELATIPPMEVLYSRLAFLVKSPLSRLAIALSEVAKKK